MQAGLSRGFSGSVKLFLAKVDVASQGCQSIPLRLDVDHPLERDPSRILKGLDLPLQSANAIDQLIVKIHSLCADLILQRPKRGPQRQKLWIICTHLNLQPSDVRRHRGELRFQGVQELGIRIRRIALTWRFPRQTAPVAGFRELNASPSRMRDHW